MKITVYCDREGILRYNPDGWPKEPLKSTGFNSHAGFVHMGGDFGHEKTVKKYNAALEKAKSESVPFENQKIAADWDHNKPDSFYDVAIDGVIEIVQPGPKANLMGQGFHLKKFKDSPKVARIVKSELSGNSEQLQSIDANKPNYIQLTNVHTHGMDRGWLELWEQIEIWYGDARTEETGEDLLMRLQKTFNLTKK